MDNRRGSEAVHSQYNLNEATFILIGDLQREAFILSNKYRNFNGSFDRWQSIRLLISARFKEKEKEKLDNLEEEFDKNIIVKYPKDLDSESAKRNYNHKIYYQEKKKNLNKYINYLMILMRVYKIGPTDLEKKHRLS